MINSNEEDILKVSFVL